MAQESDADDGEREEGSGWRGWVRDLLIAAVVMVVILGAIFAYTQVWPPLVVVESSSMQHGDSTSYVGVIDTGDLVFVQAAPHRSDVITYVEGRATGYQTYGDYGDVIIFRIASNPTLTPIIHRAIMYVIPDPQGGADVPDLQNLPPAQWSAIDTNGSPTHSTSQLTSVTIHEMGYNHNLGITFDLAYFMGSSLYHHPGYITMGDNNAYHRCFSLDPCGPSIPYDTSWFPSQGDIIGHARGEIPWLGLIKLLLSPTSSCAMGWGDPCAPANSWTDLAYSLVGIAIFPFALELALWGWDKYAWPWLRPRMPYFKDHPPKKRKGKPAKAPAEEDPTKGSSGP